MRYRSAFTLLEVLIASALLSTLMILVWSMFGTFTRLEERSSRTATEIQLTRSIAEQLRSDVAHFAIPLPKPKLSTRLGSSSRSDTDEELEATTQSDRPSSEATEQGQETPDSETPELLQETLTQETQEPLPQSDPAIALDAPRFDQPQVFDSRLLETMHFFGSPTKLELVIRQPFTVDVPAENELIGSETRYGTHLWVVYEWRAAHDLGSLLQRDPVLHPPTLPLPQQPLDPLANATGDPNPPATARPSPNLGTEELLPMAPTPLNPNENVGLIREAKSWLHVTRDRRRDAMFRQAEAAGALVDGQLPWEGQPNTQDPVSELQDFRQEDDSADSRLAAWAPPAEFRHKRDHLPEVTRLQFRYFDGQTWQLDWHSRTQLPRAIEVAFDLDPNAPAARAKEFEAAHASMLDGAALEDVLPQEDELLEDPVQDTDLLLDNRLLDPTAIATEYRFVIRMPRSPERDQDASFEEVKEGPSSEESPFENSASDPENHWTSDSAVPLTEETR